MSIFRMPSLGSDMEQATLIEWLIQPGTEVRRGDIIAVVETDKGAIEIEVFENGTLGKYLAEIGSVVPVGGPLAEITGSRTETQAEPATAEPASKPPSHPAPAQTPPAETPTAKSAPAESAPAKEAYTPAPPAGTAEHRASPAARQLAADSRIDISTLTGTGPGGAIVLADVQQALAGTSRKTVAAATVEKRPPVDLGPMRRAIAAAMARSKREIPHYYLKQSVDLTDQVEWLEQYNSDRPPAERILMSAVFLKAVALALGDYPEFNGFYEDDAFQRGSDIHVGAAIAIRGGGLVAPALHNTDKLPLDELMARWRDLVTRVRAGRFRASELSDPTITVSSLGERGVEELFGVIYPPQVACIGFGKVVDRPWSMADRTVATRAIVSVTLSADHRVSDGHRGALFLATITELLQAPERLGR